MVLLPQGGPVTAGLLFLRELYTRTLQDVLQDVAVK